MSDESSPERPSAVPAGEDTGRPRLDPRPLDRPPVDPSQATVFGRPTGVSSAFAPRPAGGQVNGSVRLAAPPPEALATAFGRPADGADVRLQRAPNGTSVDPVTAGPEFWDDTDGGDPWRDPGAGAALGPPAVESSGPDPAAGRPGPLLSVPELLFGRRVKPTALLVLFACALLVGGVGGFVGWLAGSGANSLTDAGTNIAQVDPAVERSPNSVAGLAARVSPGVVSLEVQSGSSGDIGAGVVIDSKGYILTCNHVVAAAAETSGSQITAVFSSGARVPAAIVGRDPVTDLAVLKVAATGLTVLPLGKSSALRPGDAVIAIGSPLGFADTVTSGIVSALHRPTVVPSTDGGPDAVYDAIQTDAPINPGNSGGALIDASGAVIGINASIQTYGNPNSGVEGGSIGLGFAIPIDQASGIAQQLIRVGQVKHANFGANTKSESANTSLGAYVENVTSGGAAAAAGIQPGDVITSFDGRPIGGSDDLKVAVMDHQPGQTVTVMFARQGQQHSVQVTLQSD